jgi:glyoxylase-like metal-dependent hydrolase (beta-lactamase superfamily II)
VYFKPQEPGFLEKEEGQIISKMFPRQINDNLWILGNAYFHLYLIKGNDACALFETGISATAEITLAQLASLNIKPDYLIVTHPHSDHITGLDYLKEAFPAAKVIAGEGAEAFITHPKAAKSMIAEDEYMHAAMASRGFQTKIKPIVSPPSLSGCRIVKDGDELDLGKLKIEFIEAKGHSPGNIIVHIPAIQTLLVSDSLGNYYPGRGFFPTFFTGYKENLATIERLEKFHPRKLGIAHNGFFENAEDIAGIFRSARKAVNDVRAYISNCAKDDGEIARDLFGFYHTGELAVYSPENIMNCCSLLVRRTRKM